MFGLVSSFCFYITTGRAYHDFMTPRPANIKISATDSYEEIIDHCNVHPPHIQHHSLSTAESNPYAAYHQTEVETGLN